MPDSLRLSATIPVKRKVLFAAWLDSRQHTAFTGGKARIDPHVGGKFSAWDGYITGTTLDLDSPRRIVQTWRTTDFPDGSEDSRLEITFEETDRGTRITLRHTHLPAGEGEQYKKGWSEFYFTPMKEYFRRKG